MLGAFLQELARRRRQQQLPVQGTQGNPMYRQQAAQPPVTQVQMQPPAQRMQTGAPPVTQAMGNMLQPPRPMPVQMQSPVPMRGAEPMGFTDQMGRQAQAQIPNQYGNAMQQGQWLAQQYLPQPGYQHVGGWNMAQGAQNFQPQGQTDLASLAAQYGSQDISGRALETGQTQMMNAGQALGTSVNNLNASQAGSPEVLALLAQLAKEAEFEQMYGRPMYQQQPYSSFTMG